MACGNSTVRKTWKALIQMRAATSSGEKRTRMNNKFELSIRLSENVEGMPRPIASVLYTTPNGRHKVAFEEPPSIDKLPDSDTA